MARAKRRRRRLARAGIPDRVQNPSKKMTPPPSTQSKRDQLFGFDGERGIAGDESPELLRLPRDFLDEAAIKEEGFQAGRNVGMGAIQSDAQYAVDSTNRWRLSRWRRRNSATRSFWHFSRSTLIFEIDSRR